MSDPRLDEAASRTDALTPEGCDRRDAMLDDLVLRMGAIHRGRRARRRTVAGGSVLVLTAAITVLAIAPWRGPGPVPVPVQGQPAVARSGTAPAPPDIRIVSTDPGVLDRYITTPRRYTVEIDDRTLLDELAAIDRPTGLIRTAGRVWLTADVIDAPLRPHQPGQPDRPDHREPTL